MIIISIFLCIWRKKKTRGLRHKEAKLGASPMTRFPLLPINRFHLPVPLFFRINAVGTILFQLSLRINPLFDVSRLLAIKCANGTRWRVAPGATGASVTAEGGCTNNKMAAGGAPSAPSPSGGFCQGVRRDASLARGRKGCFAKGENARVPCQFFPNVWPFEILAGPGRCCKANHHPSYLPTPIPLVPLAILRIPRLLKTTNIQPAKIFRIVSQSGTYPRHSTISGTTNLFFPR